MLISVSVLALVFVLLVLIWYYKRNNKPLPSCVKKIVNKIFYNALIRYTLLNCLKLNMLASVALFKTGNTYGQRFQASFIFTTFNSLAIIYSYVLCTNSKNLND